MRLLETAFIINQLPKWHPICASSCQKELPLPSLMFPSHILVSPLMSEPAILQLRQWTRKRGSPHWRAMTMKRPTSRKIRSLIWAAAHLQTHWHRLKGGDGNAGLGQPLSAAAHKPVNWEHQDIFGKKLTGLSPPQMHCEMLLKNCYTDCTCHKQVFSGSLMQLPHGVGKHLPVADTGNSSKRHIIKPGVGL